MSEPVILTHSEATQAALIRGRSLQGSGILCWAQCPDTKEIYFLLGREDESNTQPRRSHHRNKMKGWCDFGGCNKRFYRYDPLDGEGETAAQTAAREFVEETCGMVSLDCVTNTNCKTVQTALQHGRFDFVITTKANKGKRRYVCFVCKVPWDPLISVKFTNMRTLLSRLYHDVCNVHRLQKQIPHSPPYFRPGMTVGKATVVRAVQDVLWDSTEKRLKLLMETQPEHDVGEPTLMWYTFDVDDGDRFIETYVDWVKCRQKMLRVYLNLPLEVRHHPSMKVMYKYGNVFNLSINPDFLEKDELRWWSLTELKEAANQCPNPFRPCFRSVVRLAVEHFDNNKESI